MTAVELKVRGMVQGVGYRYFCQTRATALGLTGWVRNLSDGSVQLLVEGEKSIIETFIELLRTGPSNASVENIDTRWTTYTGKFHSFQITR
jgi:acylphosphatase